MYFLNEWLSNHLLFAQLAQLDVTELGSRPKDLAVQYMDLSSARPAAARKGSQKASGADDEVLVVALSMGKVAVSGNLYSCC